MNGWWFRRGWGFAALSALLFFVAAPLRSHDPITTRLTWSQEISRLVYARCATCHHAGGPAMSLTTYAEARPWAKAIRDEVLTRRMPPWGAVKGIGEFAGDPSLTQPEIDMLVGWVEGGAPEGDPALLPARPPDFHVPAAAVPKYARTLVVSGSAVLSRASSVVAIRPKNLPENGSLEAWAMQPDGQVERLLWLRDYRRKWDRPYVFTKPVRLPAGTKLRVSGTGGAMLFFAP